MYISDFNYHKPIDLQEVSKLLAQNRNSALLAGGTDLLVEIKCGLRTHSDIISLQNIPELKIISNKAGFINIGACVSHQDLINSVIINEKLYALAEAAKRIGTHQIRNSGTIGGNLCTGASCADTAPILMAYDAKVELFSSSGKRILSLNEFLIAHHKTVIKKEEILTNIIVPVQPAGSGACFEKFGLREAASISVASVAVVVQTNGKIISNANIVIGACASTPIFSKNAKDLLIDKSISELLDDKTLLEKLGLAAVNDTLPIDDIRGSADYRRELVRTLVKRATLKAIDRMKNE